MVPSCPVPTTPGTFLLRGSLRNRVREGRSAVRQLPVRHHRSERQQSPPGPDATADAASTTWFGQAARFVGFVLGAAVFTFVLSGALATPADAGALPDGLVWPDGLASTTGLIAPSGVLSDVTTTGTTPDVSTVVSAVPIASEVSSTPVGAVVATLSDGEVAKQVGSDATDGTGGAASHTGLGPITSTPGSGHKSAPPVTGPHVHGADQTRQSAGVDSATAAVPISLTGVSALPPLSLPSAKSNASLSPSHGNGPFDGLAAMVLLVPALIIGALALALRRNKHLLHRTPWARPG